MAALGLSNADLYPTNEDWAVTSANLPDLVGKRVFTSDRCVCADADVAVVAAVLAVDAVLAVVVAAAAVAVVVAVAPAACVVNTNIAVLPARFSCMPLCACCRLVRIA